MHAARRYTTAHARHTERRDITAASMLFIAAMRESLRCFATLSLPYAAVCCCRYAMPLLMPLLSVFFAAPRWFR